MENALQTNKCLINRYKGKFVLFRHCLAASGLTKNSEIFISPAFLENFRKING